MTTFIERKHLGVPADGPWQALLRMNEWLPTLSTIKSVEVLGETRSPFAVIGRHYRVHTPEGVTMNAELVNVDHDERTVEIHAKAGPLRSKLTCRVVDHGSHCSLVRIQRYPGIVGTLFATVFKSRELKETQAYLEAWARAVDTDSSH